MYHHHHWYYHRYQDDNIIDYEDDCTKKENNDDKNMEGDNNNNNINKDKTLNSNIKAYISTCIFCEPSVTKQILNDCHDCYKTLQCASTSKRRFRKQPTKQQTNQQPHYYRKFFLSDRHAAPPSPSSPLASNRLLGPPSINIFGSDVTPSQPRGATLPTDHSNVTKGHSWN